MRFDITNNPKKQAIKVLVLCSFLIWLTPATGFAQTKKLPAVEVKDLNGKPFDFSGVSNGGKPIIVVFWATWCKPCTAQLNTINELYSDWQEETGVKLVAVSVDDARNAPKVKPMVGGKGWEYEVYLDENQDLKRAMSVNNVPHTFIVNGSGEIVWEHNNYSPGDENEIIERVRKAEADKNSVKSPK